ncbi:MAG TPA: type II secretion system F family protein [Firmicutes bacterium]|nr:type II secretion system F family protein [Bacillota bacterium]HHT43234.1 type II secretion system F family protein [Bacillota bacterium]
MIRYAYTGRSRSGKAVKGFIEAENEGEARTQLRQEGYIVTSLKAAREPIALFQKRVKLKAKHLALFCRQFAIMLSTGLSLVRALGLLEEQAAEPGFSKVLQSIRLDVASGTAFTRTLEKHRDVFPHVFIHLVEAGEVSGTMPEVLDRLATYYEREDELRKKISEALMYPAIITSVSFVMVIVLLFVVLPMLVKNFAGFGVETPAITLAVLNSRDWMVSHWYVVVGLIAALIMGWRYWVRTKPGRWMRDSVLLSVPVLGEMQKMVIFSRFCRTLALLLNSGIAMIPTLQILERLMDNVVVKKALEEARHGVERGEGISQPLGNHKVFPAMLVQMVAVGEETGNLETVLVQLADYYDREVNFTVASFTKLLEPAVMLVLAVVVLFILISVYLPMMQMVTAI